MNPSRTVCIFCGAHVGNSAAVVTEAQALSSLLAGKGYDLVYGGGNNGLMGIVADAFLAAGRQVVGIRPQKLIRDESAHLGIHELMVVKDMHERKLKMIEAADIFIALPGGAGTLDELIEVYTQTKIGFVQKTCAILNTEGFYNDLLRFMDKMVDYGFLRAEDLALLLVADTPADLAAHFPAL